MNILLKIITIGVGATLILDLWNYLLSLLHIKSLNYRYVGRWIGNFVNGKFYHSNIMITPHVQNELFIGWAAHYLIGISFSFMLMIVFGNEWLEKPSFLPAVIFGFVTVVFPLFIMQPALGFGFASSNFPNPIVRILKSIVTHLIYGSGLYLSALLVNKI
ncbi:MAG: DUF2938 domain-containing protein [Ignavibacterium sp.]|nr:DUF2938 domain-containing protein [Ignavibacterium sp.]